MAWAVFTKTYTHDFRPERGVSKDYYPSETPQQVTRAVLDAAITAGKAEQSSAPKKAKSADAETGSD